MWLDEELSETHPLVRKVEYMTLQSCERSEVAIHYKNISRKFIVFDLRDKPLMVQVARSLKAFGMWQTLQNYFLNSRFSLVSAWAEAALAKRGEAHIRNLYLKHPAKFFDLEYEDAKSVKMRLVKCSYTISEMTSSKRVPLNDNPQSAGLMDKFREKILQEEERLFIGKQLFDEFAPETKSHSALIEAQEE